MKNRKIKLLTEKDNLDEILDLEERMNNFYEYYEILYSI